MNDHDAIDQINAVLDRHFRGELTQAQTLAQICTITGQNSIQHAEAKKEQP
ncbi:hypothetical protein [Arthrobacter sp. B3I4]|uniref:hypothetical protein n=1 Tax=Arthrobacter sp. B3I4 TaxID=3042267 RepID=UPI00277D5A6B|nr:hypothetical protein [Arthrobacter sp. B3I4]MDQ0756118.1 hypothetical protein [Arthrobacter sp. B3I4]